jgi:hypothetical protein
MEKQVKSDDKVDWWSHSNQRLVGWLEALSLSETPNMRIRNTWLLFVGTSSFRCVSKRTSPVFISNKTDAIFVSGPMRSHPQIPPLLPLRHAGHNTQTNNNTKKLCHHHRNPGRPNKYFSCVTHLFIILNCTFQPVMQHLAKFSMF